MGPFVQPGLLPCVPVKQSALPLLKPPQLTSHRLAQDLRTVCGFSAFNHRLNAPDVCSRKLCVQKADIETVSGSAMDVEQNGKARPTHSAIILLSYMTPSIPLKNVGHLPRTVALFRTMFSVQNHIMCQCRVRCCAQHWSP